MPAVVTKVFGTWSVDVHIFPEDAGPGEASMCPAKCPKDGGNAVDMDIRDRILGYHWKTSTDLMLQDVWNGFDCKRRGQIKTSLWATLS